LKVSEVKQETEELLNSVKDAIQFSEEVGNTIIACFNLSGPFKVLDCVVTETSQASKEALSVVTSIRNKVIEVKKSLLLAVSDLSQCAGAELQDAQQRVADILRSITVCVDGKLNPHIADYKTPLLLNHSN
jgi:flagellar hook-basal body complex protein FliE